MTEDQDRTADSFSDDELKEIIKMYQTRINNIDLGFKYKLTEIYAKFHIRSHEEQKKIFNRIKEYTEDVADYTCKYCHEPMKISYFGRKDRYTSRIFCKDCGHEILVNPVTLKPIPDFLCTCSNCLNSRKQYFDNKVKELTDKEILRFTNKINQYIDQVNEEKIKHIIFSELPIEEKIKYSKFYYDFYKDLSYEELVKDFTTQGNVNIKFRYSDKHVFTLQEIKKDYGKLVECYPRSDNSNIKFNSDYNENINYESINYFEDIFSNHSKENGLYSKYFNYGNQYIFISDMFFDNENLKQRIKFIYDLVQFFKDRFSNKEYLLYIWKKENFKLALAQVDYLMCDKYLLSDAVKDKIKDLIDVFPIAQVLTLLWKISQDCQRWSDEFGSGYAKKKKFIENKIMNFNNFERLHNYKYSPYEYLHIDTSSYDFLNKQFNNNFNKNKEVVINLFYTTCNEENLDHFIEENDFLANFSVQNSFNLENYKKKLLADD